MREIRFFRTSSGRSPVEEFLISLPPKARQKVAFVLRIIREIDRVPAEYFKKLKSSDDLWEVRVGFGGNIYRLLGFWKGDSVIILVSGFTKKSQKTPLKELKLAEQRKNEYLKRGIS